MINKMSTPYYEQRAAYVNVKGVNITSVRHGKTKAKNRFLFATCLFRHCRSEKILIIYVASHITNHDEDGIHCNGQYRGSRVRISSVGV